MLKHYKLSQHGFVLITGLIFLLVLTLIGISSMNGTALNEKMTSNFRNTNIAFNAGESALGAGESWILTQNSVPNVILASQYTMSNCPIKPCVLQNNAYGTSYSVYTDDSWWQTYGISYPYASSALNVAFNPYYTIEQFQFVPYQLSPDAESKGQGYFFYKVTARGTGTEASSHSIVQSIYATQFN